MKKKTDTVALSTQHQIFFNSSVDMSKIADESVDLVVTSPPYPMIKMWDDVMQMQNSKLTEEFIESNPKEAFELMHQELDKVWNECYRVLKPGSFFCINIGDATRTVNNVFQLFNNHSRITQYCTQKLGLINLPNIIWRKPSNSPTKFIGSGMLPCGAYVTLEHEYILIFKKDGKRDFSTDEAKSLRKRSSYFWEERNKWFTDTWNVNGVRQQMEDSTARKRSGAYPIEIPYRLINMYSLIGDVVLDPFAGTGTTSLAAMITNRNSIGFEINSDMEKTICNFLKKYDKDVMNEHIYNRYLSHLNSVDDRKHDDKPVGNFNKKLNCAVVNQQESEISFNYVNDVIVDKSNKRMLSIKIEYSSANDNSNHITAPAGLSNSLF